MDSQNSKTSNDQRRETASELPEQHKNLSRIEDLFGARGEGKTPKSSSKEVDSCPSEIDEILRDLIAASEERMEREAKQRASGKVTSPDRQLWSWLR